MWTNFLLDFLNTRKTYCDPHSMANMVLSSDESIASSNIKIIGQESYDLKIELLKTYQSTWKTRIDISEDLTKEKSYIVHLDI